MGSEVVSDAGLFRARRVPDTECRSADACGGPAPLHDRHDRDIPEPGPIPTFSRDMVTAVQGLVVLFCGALALMLRPLVARLWTRRARRVAPAGEGA